MMTNPAHARTGGDPGRTQRWVPAFAGTIGVVVAMLFVAPCISAHASDTAISESESHPFNEKANAMADVDAALAAAAARGTRVLLVLGGNWCHDSRGLAEKFETPELAALIAERYELVWVDVGHRDRNMDVPKRFGVDDLLGTPTVLILSADGQLLNAGSVHDWRNAASRTIEETSAYFRKWSGL